MAITTQYDLVPTIEPTWIAGQQVNVQSMRRVGTQVEVPDVNVPSSSTPTVPAVVSSSPTVTSSPTVHPNEIFPQGHPVGAPGLVSDPDLVSKLIAEATARWKQATAPLPSFNDPVPLTQAGTRVITATAAYPYPMGPITGGTGAAMVKTETEDSSSYLWIGLAIVAFLFLKGGK